MSDKHSPNIDPDALVIYQIRIKGHLGHHWAGDMSITLEEDGNTLLTGPVVDQAALYGLLRKIRDSGINLLSVNIVPPETN